MSNRPAGATLRQIHALSTLGAAGLLTDGQLLERFAARNGRQAESAFAALLERHGPMVFGVCKAVLADEDMARDAFQATFLVLFRKADSLWVQDSLGPWLHRVAYRAAQSHRSSAERRRIHERHAAELSAVRANSSEVCDDLTRGLQEEIARLPDRYRIPIVICDLEGRTHEEASRHLRCPVGTVKSRLARGRQRLRSRMLRRGLGLSIGAIAALSAKASRAAIPEALLGGTIGMVMEAVSGRTVAGIAPAAILLARETNHVMLQTTLAKSATVAITIAFLTLGALATARQSGRESPKADVAAGRTMTIHVVDRDGKPLGGAHVFKNHVYKPPGDERPKIENRDYRTGAGGAVTITLSGASVDLRIWARRQGFIPLHAMWAKKFQSDGDRIPEEFTFRLDRGTVIGGSVVDEGGRPIAGVKVEVIDPAARSFHAHRLLEPVKRPVRAYALAEDDAILTDEQGRWSLGNVPPDKDLEIAADDPDDPNVGPSATPLAIELRLNHPDHVSDGIGWGGLQRRQGVTLKSLRDRTATIVLRKK